jgi:hypothetical protein
MIKNLLLIILVCIGIEVLIIFLLSGGGPAFINADCSKDKDFKRFDSILSKGMYDDTIINQYINDPGYLVLFRTQLCNHVNKYNRITYIETISFLSQRRTGLIYLPDSKKFFSFRHNKRDATLIFEKGVDKESLLYKLMKKFENDYKWDAEKLQNAYNEAKGESAPAIKYVQVNDSIVSSFTIAYDPTKL